MPLMFVYRDERYHPYSHTERPTLSSFAALRISLPLDCYSERSEGPRFLWIVILSAIIVILSAAKDLAALKANPSRSLP